MTVSDGISHCPKGGRSRRPKSATAQNIISYDDNDDQPICEIISQLQRHQMVFLYIHAKTVELPSVWPLIIKVCVFRP